MLSKFSVKKPYTVVVAIVLVLILGVVSYTKMSIDLIPSVNLPYAVVTTTYLGATPEKVEQVVTSPLEQVMASVNNIKNINSISAENMSIIILEFNEDTNMDSATIELRENLDMVSSFFPDEIGNPAIMKINPDMMPIMVMSASIEGMSDEESATYIEDKLVPLIKSVEGVASVSTTGLVENMIDVTLSKEKIANVNADISEFYAKKAMEMMVGNQIIDIEQSQEQSQMPSNQQGMQKMEITKELVSNILKGQNFAMPSNSIASEDGTTQLLRVGDKLQSIKELENLVIMSIPEYGSIKLSDVANLNTYDNLDSMYSKINGNYAIMLAMQKQPHYSTADVANNIQKKADEIIIDHPNIRFDVLMNQGQYVNVMIERIISNLLLGSLFAVIILYLFLRKIRPTLIVGASIIISVIGAFVLMYFSGITLNMISMGGLALGVGMLVDNSIVVIENIYRMRSEGKSAKDAAIEGAREVSGAITASTLTTVIVFLPIVFTQGITRQLFTDMALTIGFSLLASLVVALTLVPAASSVMLKSNIESKKTIIDKLVNVYTKALNKSLKYNWVSLILAVALLIVSITLAFSSNVSLFPSMDSGNITVSVNMPDTFSKQDRFEALDKLNDTLLSIDDIQTVGIMDTTNSTENSNAFMNMVGSGTTIYVLLDEDREASTENIVETIRNNTKDFNFEVTVSNSNMDMSMLTSGQIVINAYGRELDELREIAKNIGMEISSIKGVTEVDNGLGKVGQDMRVVVDKDKAIEKGLTVAQVYVAISDAIKSDSVTTTLTAEDFDYSVYVKDDRDINITSEKIQDITIQSPMGDSVKIGDISDIENSEGFSAIRRKGQERYVSITASLEEGYNIKEINSLIEEKLDKLDLPKGCRFEISGEMESIKDAFNDLFLMLALAIVFIYLVMVAQFQSLLSPFIVMFTIPLAFTGGFLALYICNMPVSIISLIGLIVLVGIVVNNGIVFVDYTNQQMNKGYNKKEALLIAAKNRLRPILMTALTTIIALIAMAFDRSSGAEILRPMAITTIGGMIYSTILTLFIIPAMYYIFKRDKKENR
ncbi:efflux RND transporter permease subunit [Sedimentibacter sp. zth1]|uniref:efflux RND transporter permease subunit n=1 Tax=Sedimentibacter sp. zth1 TaxID=2816908 RepID=UPI001A924851|nr:efflux RND transporter permease subunit [Sedimentibacter sp. zth1]QSX05506.1 efflux RND transporter permease subunit [Sedimentibacter sp. zth1]